MAIKYVCLVYLCVNVLIVMKIASQTAQFGIVICLRLAAHSMCQRRVDKTSFL